VRLAEALLGAPGPIARKLHSVVREICYEREPVQYGRVLTLQGGDPRPVFGSASARGFRAGEVPFLLLAPDTCSR
jgi:hypothetical protein